MPKSWERWSHPPHHLPAQLLCAYWVPHTVLCQVYRPPDPGHQWSPRVRAAERWLLLQISYGKTQGCFRDWGDGGFSDEVMQGETWAGPCWRKDVASRSRRAFSVAEAWAREQKQGWRGPTASPQTAEGCGHLSKSSSTHTGLWEESSLAMLQRRPAKACRGWEPGVWGAVLWG